MKPLILIPQPALRPYIRHYVQYEMGAEGKWTSIDSAPPGCTALVIAGDGKNVLVKEKEGEPIRYESVVFAGQTISFKKIFLYDRLKLFFVIFQPWGAYRLLGIHQGECTNVMNNLTDLLGSSIRPLKEELTEQVRVKDIQSLVERFFLTRAISSNQRIDWQRLAYTLKQIRLFSYKDSLIKEICRDDGYSISRLERHMKKIVGVSPKQYQRIMRFNTVLKYLDRNSFDPNWSAIASQFGYFDQTHFIKEFKLFYGKTPAGYAEEDRLLSSIAISKKKPTIS